MITLKNGRDELFQWDIGQRILLTDETLPHEVHFRNTNSTKALVVLMQGNEAPIPNILLQEPYPIEVLLYYEDLDESYTIKRKTFTVIPRPQPEDYIYTETEVLNYETVLNIAQSVRDDADAGEFDGAKGDQGDKGDKGEKGDKGDTGNSPIVFGEAEPTDPEAGVWFNQTGEGLTGNNIPMEEGDTLGEQLVDIMSDVQRIDNALAPLSLNIDSWKSVQQAVKAGLAPKVFPIGTQLIVGHSDYGDRLYDVVAHDYMKSAHDQNAHTMTILQHDLLPVLQFDAPEAFYYAEVALPAGKYNFTIATTYASWLAGTYEFTLTQAVPAGGQLAISGYSDADMTARQVRSFASRTTTAVTESVAIIFGNGGTNLGTFGEQLNHAHRVSYGSNNYKESAMRQFLNSSAAAGSVWTPQTKFDRPPSWLTTTAGFVAGLSQEFLAVVGDVVLPCSANNTYEALDSTVVKNTKYTLNEKFYLLSQREVFGTNTDIVADDSVLLPFYDGATAADRIKYRDGSAVTWWLRAPNSWGAYSVRRVLSDGTLNNYTANDSGALAPACTIV